MNFDDTGLLLSGLIVSAIGAGVFLYGKKQGNPKCIIAGLGLSLFPYFVPSIVATWLILAATLAGLYFMPSGE